MGGPKGPLSVELPSRAQRGARGNSKVYLADEITTKCPRNNWFSLLFQSQSTTGTALLISNEGSAIHLIPRNEARYYLIQAIVTSTLLALPLVDVALLTLIPKASR